MSIKEILFPYRGQVMKRRPKARRLVHGNRLWRLIVGSLPAHIPVGYRGQLLYCDGRGRSGLTTNRARAPGKG